MLGLVWYVGCLAGAFVWMMGSTTLSRRLTVGEIVAGSLAIGTIAPAYITYLIGSCLSMLEHQTLILSNALIVYLVAERTPSFLREMRRRLAEGATARAKGVWLSQHADSLVAAALVGVGALFFVPLYSTRMIPEQDGKIFSGGSCWADLPIHMHIAESFLSGRNQDVSWGDMHSPVFAGEKMYYPFIPDWHAAVLVKIGTSMRRAFLLPGLVMCFSFIALFYFFARRLTRSRLGAVLGLLLTIGSGGQGGINILLRDGLKRALEQDVIQNDVTGEGKVFWFAFVPHVFLPQRGANFAYPLALFVLLLVWRATDMTAQPDGRRIDAGDRRRMLMYAGALAGLTPLVQAHTFIALGMLIATVFVLDAHKWLADLRILGGWLAAGAVALLTGGPQMALFRKHVEKGHGGSFIKYGWIYGSHEFGTATGLWSAIPLAGGFFRFWWMSLGPAVPLFLLALAAYAYDAYSGMSVGERPQDAAAAAAGLYDSSLKYASGGVEGSREGAGAEPASRAHASGISDSGAGLVQRKGLRATAAAAGTADSDEDDALASASAPRMRGATGAAPAHVPGTGPDVSLAEHLIAVTLAQMPLALQDVLTGRTPVRYTALDRLVSPGNSSSVSGRALDALKLGVGAGIVFLFGNYVNLQPWDRDNCKLFYLWVFIATALVGSLLAAPIEYLARLTSSAGGERVLQAVFVPQRDILASRDEARKAKSEDKTGGGAAAGRIGGVKKALAGTVALGWLLAVPVLMFFACASGFMLFAREYSLYHQLLDEDQIRMGNYIKEHIAPKAVIMHRDIHIMPSGCIAGRPSLVAYTGWMWSHGYNYYDRDRDRKYVHENALKDSDQEAYNGMRRWGVRYLLGEHMPTHHRPRQQQYEEAVARKAADPNDTTEVPAFDPDSYLDGQLKRVFRSGRMDLLEVQGYGFPPG